ncbi:MAG: redoxin domain-containing protein [Armatimonadetes bacterium]|nr:redoxin domain-containing protein [Armatimonadota bacterium]
MKITTTAALLVTMAYAGAQKAPDLAQGQWFNTAKPITKADLKDHVAVVFFWTFDCINCKRSLPAMNRMYERFAKQGVKFVGIHTPETQTERKPANVRAALTKEGIKFPVLIDNDAKNWYSWHQTAWPTVYLIDRHGNIRFSVVGELNFNGQNDEAKLDTEIEKLKQR